MTGARAVDSNSFNSVNRLGISLSKLLTEQVLDHLYKLLNPLPIDSGFIDRLRNDSRLTCATRSNIRGKVINALRVLM
jgi:hypothetical protein